MSWLSNLFGGGNNNSQQAALAAQQAQARAEEERQGRIREGKAGIDTAFQQFDPTYYQNYQNTVKDYYTPDVNRQYDLAKDKMIATLAGRGTLESTVGASKFGELEGTRTGALAEVGNKAVDASNELKSKVEGAKTNLYQLNANVADPSLAASQASGAAASIVAPQTLSPLGSVFANVLNGIGTVNKSDATSMNPSLPWNQGYWSPAGGRGSSMTVR